MVNIFSRINKGIQKISSLIPIYGFWGAIQQVTRNILLFETTYRFEKQLIVPEEKYIPKISLELTTLSGTENLDSWIYCDEIRSIRGEFGLSQFRERLANGFVLFYATANHKLAGFIWLNSWPVQGAGYHLSADEAYHIDGWVIKEYRGAGVLPSLQQSVFNYLRDKHPEIRLLIGHASTWNKPSISGQLKAGLILTAKELSITIFGFHRKYRINTISN